MTRDTPDDTSPLAMTITNHPKDVKDGGDVGDHLAMSPIFTAADAASISSSVVDIQGDSKQTLEDRLVRKLDLTVFPILFLVFTMSFLDRINISNARIQGLTEELELTGNRFNIALFVRHVPQIKFLPAFLSHLFPFQSIVTDLLRQLRSTLSRTSCLRFQAT